MDLIILLITLCVWGVLKVKEDVSAAIYDANRSMELIQREQLKSRVTNINLEQELRLIVDYLENQENYHKLLDEVAEAYDSIFEGKRFEDVYPRTLWNKPKSGWTYEYHKMITSGSVRLNRTNAMRIMLAKRGYIPRGDISKPYVNDGTERSKLERYVLFWCEKKLHEQGVPVSLVTIGDGKLRWDLR